MWLAYVPLLAALFITSRPYHGIVHDARLYLMQALARLQPERLGEDRFFIFGSEDNFSIFSAIYAPIVASIGPAAAHDIVTAIGLACWFAALLSFTMALFGPGRVAILAAAAVILLNPRYSAFGVFQYGEPFTTPRIFAEALAMAALAAHRRPCLATPCLLAAAAIHPLMALPAIGVLGLIAVWHKPRLWLLAGAGLLLAGALAWAGVDPFARALMRYDDEWFQIVQQRSPFGFLGRWNWQDLIQSIAPLTGFVIGWHTASKTERQMLASVSIVAGVAMFATWLGADLFHNVLVTSLQPWRALWLFALIGNAFVAVAALRLRRPSETLPFLCLALALGVAEQALYIPPVCSSVIFGLALAAHLWERWKQRPLPRVIWLLGMLIALLLMIAVAYFAVFFVIPTHAQGLGAISLIVSGFVLAAACTLLLLLTNSDARTRYVALITGTVLLLGACTIVDQRTGWQRFVSSAAQREEISSFLGDDRNVYWETAFDLLWFKQRRTSYFSCVQASGVMFNASAARQWRQRAIALSALNVLDFQTDSRSLCPPVSQSAQNAPPHAEDLVRVCKQLPDLDALILLERVSGLQGVEWHAPPDAEIGGTGNRRPTGSPVFYRYRCAALR